jgi:hypothetical protein
MAAAAAVACYDQDAPAACAAEVPVAVGRHRIRRTVVVPR